MSPDSSRRINADYGIDEAFKYNASTYTLSISATNPYRMLDSSLYYGDVDF